MTGTRRGRGSSSALGVIAVVALFGGAHSSRSGPSAARPEATPVRDTAGGRLSPALAERFDKLEETIAAQLDASDTKRLRIEAALARQAVDAGNLLQAAALLDAFDDTVLLLRANEEVDDRRVADILVALGDVEDALASYAAARG